MLKILEYITFQIYSYIYQINAELVIIGDFFQKYNLKILPTPNFLTVSHELLSMQNVIKKPFMKFDGHNVIYVASMQ